MPGFNRTGPRGMGPMTGGGRGYCNPRGTGVANPFFGGGRGRGYGFRNYNPVTAEPITDTATASDSDIEMLKQDIQALKAELSRLGDDIRQMGNK